MYVGSNIDEYSLYKPVSRKTKVKPEASVDELYGDSKDDKWKKEEVKRLKNEQGIVDDVEIPAINVPVKDIETGIDLKKEGVVDENKE